MTRARAGPERVLLRAYHDYGDVEAREKLIEQYLPLVRSIALQHARRQEQLEDLVQVGAIGLMKAIDRFDIDRGVELTTYATPTIAGEIRRYFRDTGWAVRVPRRLQELNLRVTKLADDLSRELGRSPTISELAERAAATSEEVRDALATGNAQAAVSLAAPPRGGGGDDGSTGDVDERYGVTEDRALLAPAVRVLDVRERRVLHLRFYQGLPQAQIALELGISPMHVSRICNAALQALRNALTADDATPPTRGVRGRGASSRRGEATVGPCRRDLPR